MQKALNDEFERQWILQADYVNPIGKDAKIEMGLRTSFRDMINDYISSVNPNDVRLMTPTHLATHPTNPEIFWSVIMSMYIGMVVLLILNLPLIPYIARILAVPRTFLIPMILFFSVTGIYLMSFNNFDIFLMISI